MLRVEPPPVPLALPPPQPASTADAIKKNATPAQAYWLRCAASVRDNKKAIMANAAASHARKTNGELGGRTSIMPGGSAERVVCSVAVQDAPVLLVAPAAAPVAAAPKLTPAFKNCTV